MRHFRNGWNATSAWRIPHNLKVPLCFYQADVSPLKAPLTTPSESRCWSGFVWFWRLRVMRSGASRKFPFVQTNHQSSDSHEATCWGRHGNVMLIGPGDRHLMSTCRIISGINFHLAKWERKTNRFWKDEGCRKMRSWTRSELWSDRVEITQLLFQKLNRDKRNMLKRIKKKKQINFWRFDENQTWNYEQTNYQPVLSFSSNMNKLNPVRFTFFYFLGGTIHSHWPPGREAAL